MSIHHLAIQFSEEGLLALPDATVQFKDLQWHPHAVFEEVALKHLVTSKQTEGKSSYHLVRIEASKKIGTHSHETQIETHEVIFGTGACINDTIRIEYRPGVISILEKKVEHEVIAGGEGLYLFAKFIPALL